MVEQDEIKELKALFSSGKKAKESSFHKLIDRVDANDITPPILKKGTTHIQVSYDNGEEWENLVALSDITGPQGIQGTPGKNGTDGAKGATGPQGNPGKDGATGAKGADAPKLTKIEIKTDESGKILSGTGTMSDSTTVPITITVSK